MNTRMSRRVKSREYSRCSNRGIYLSRNVSAVKGGASSWCGRRFGLLACMHCRKSWMTVLVLNGFRADNFFDVLERTSAWFWPTLVCGFVSFFIGSEVLFLGHTGRSKPRHQSLSFLCKSQLISSTLFEDLHSIWQTVPTMQPEKVWIQKTALYRSEKSCSHMIKHTNSSVYSVDGRNISPAI